MCIPLGIELSCIQLLGGEYTNIVLMFLGCVLFLHMIKTVEMNSWSFSNVKTA
jgi:hypothetical protein